MNAFKISGFTKSTLTLSTLLKMLNCKSLILYLVSLSDQSLGFKYFTSAFLQNASRLLFFFYFSQEHFVLVAMLKAVLFMHIQVYYTFVFCFQHIIKPVVLEDWYLTICISLAHDHFQAI